MWDTCCSVVTKAISTSPAANMPVNTMPSAASSFSRECDWMKPEPSAQAMPATNAPSPSDTPAAEASTTPGSTACEMASPSSDQPLSTMKQEISAQATATTVPTAIAWSMKP